MRRVSLRLGEDALHLADLFHEMELRGQPPRRVGDHHVDAARPRRRQRVVDDGARIARRLRDDRDVVALAPDDELLARRCAEGIARSKEHALALRLQPLGELADRGGLARAVDAGNHHHVGLGAADLELLLQRRKQLGQRILERLLERFSILDFLLARFLAQRSDEPLGGGDAAIGLQERRLEICEE